jgi:hypothetical protein
MDRFDNRHGILNRSALWSSQCKTLETDLSDLMVMKRANYMPTGIVSVPKPYSIPTVIRQTLSLPGVDHPRSHGFSAACVAVSPGTSRSRSDLIGRWK